MGDSPRKAPRLLVRYTGDYSVLYKAIWSCERKRHIVLSKGKPPFRRRKVRNGEILPDLMAQGLFGIPPPHLLYGKEYIEIQKRKGPGEKEENKPADTLGLDYILFDAELIGGHDVRFQYDDRRRYVLGSAFCIGGFDFAGRVVRYAGRCSYKRFTGPLCSHGKQKGKRGQKQPVGLKTCREIFKLLQ